MGAVTFPKNDNPIFWAGEIESCGECSDFADYLCDWPMGRGETCDHRLCEAHAHPIGEDRHLCPVHARVFKATGALTPIRMKRLCID